MTQFSYSRAIITIAMASGMLAGLAGERAGAGVVIGTTSSIVESFERGFGPWTPHAWVAQQPHCQPDCEDLLDASIEMTDAFAHQGAQAVELHAQGVLDDGTLWIQRPVELPAGTHDLRVDFQLFWPHPHAEIGTWEVVAHIGAEPAAEESDFTILGLTGVSGWTLHSHEATLTLARPGTAYVAVGINVVFESELTYGIDSVTISGASGPIPSADLNGDGDVNGIDLALLLGVWSGGARYAPCPPLAPADFSRDCRVDGVDLAMLLAQWS